MILVYADHTIGKGEAESSNLSGSTRQNKHLGLFFSPSINSTGQERGTNCPDPVTHC